MTSSIGSSKAILILSDGTRLELADVRLDIRQPTQTWAENGHYIERTFGSPRVEMKALVTTISKLPQRLSLLEYVKQFAGEIAMNKYVLPATCDGNPHTCTCNDKPAKPVSFNKLIADLKAANARQAKLVKSLEKIRTDQMEPLESERAINASKLSDMRAEIAARLHNLT